MKKNTCKRFVFTGGATTQGWLKLGQVRDHVGSSRPHVGLSWIHSELHWASLWPLGENKERTEKNSPLQPTGGRFKSLHLQ